VTYLEKLRSDPRVADVSDERGQEHGIWVYLRQGWDTAYDPLQVTRTIHEDTVGEIRVAMKRVVKDDGSKR
jgi:hypothetical protein